MRSEGATREPGGGASGDVGGGAGDDPGGVTVVVPHYGSPAPARALVDQLLAQPGRHPRQLVVVDDCSPEPYPDDTPGVHVVRRERNGGFGTAVNSGARLAEHDLLLVLNSDLVVPEGFVEELLAAAAPLQPVVAAPTVVTRGAPSGGHRFPRARFQAVERLAVLARWQRRRWWRAAVGKVDGPAPGGSRRVDWVTGEAVLVPTAWFRAVGGFDESFYMYAEEVDLQRRLSAHGVGSVLLGTTPVQHVGAASTDPARSATWLLRSRLHYAEKWGGAGRLRCALTAAVLTTLLTESARRAAGRPVRPWQAARADLARIWG